MPAPWTIPAAVSGRKPFGEVPCVLVDNEQIEWIPRDLSLSLLRIPYAGDLIVASSFRRLGIPTLCEVGTLHPHEWNRRTMRGRLREIVGNFVRLGAAP